MREIKFRAWHEVSGMKYFRFVDIENFEDPAYCETLPNICFEDGDYRPLRDCVVMQYTGLKDKNGKEIYEGDIIKINLLEYEQSILIVEYNHKYACYCFMDGTNWAWGWDECQLGDIEYWEVIGNIYENPELLNVGSGELNGEPKSQVSK